MTLSQTKLGWIVGVVVLAGAAWASSTAQGLGQANDNSMAALTNEVRLLRGVIQDVGRGQTQMQALSISLTAQQSRLAQVSDRLDKVHTELEAASRRTEEARRMIADAEAEIARAPNVKEREGASEMLEIFKKQAQSHADEETRLRAREAELTTQFRVEEDRWVQLVAKLEEIIKR